jgi:hypothetical protein
VSAKFNKENIVSDKQVMSYWVEGEVLESTLEPGKIAIFRGWAGDYCKYQIANIEIDGKIYQTGTEWLKKERLRFVRIVFESNIEYDVYFDCYLIGKLASGGFQARSRCWFGSDTLRDITNKIDFLF